MLFCAFMHKFAWIALAAVCPSAFGWGPEGHALIARIAETQLTPKARDQIAAILGPGSTLVSIASWADEIRRSRPETGGWHYIDIPINRPHLDMARDCPKGNCVIAKIEDFEKAVADPSTPPAARREDLMFLIHFVSDMHQPLHSSDNQDRGGNSVHVRFAGRNLNLHSLWDSALLARMGNEDQLEAAWAKDSAKHEKKWSKGSVEDWAEQSHKEAQKVVYRKLPAGTPPTINAAYEKAADSLIRLQIEKAGARLARVLNQTLQ
jgi:hypothetical protein